MPMLKNLTRITGFASFKIDQKVYPESWTFAPCLVNIDKLVYSELVPYNGAQVTALYMEDGSVLHVTEVYDLDIGVWKFRALPTFSRHSVEGS